jgi:hypothetical protein
MESSDPTNVPAGNQTRWPNCRREAAHGHMPETGSKHQPDAQTGCGSPRLMLETLGGFSPLMR